MSSAEVFHRIWHCLWCAQQHEHSFPLNRKLFLTWFFCSCTLWNHLHLSKAREGWSVWNKTNHWKTHSCLRYQFVRIQPSLWWWSKQCTHFCASGEAQTAQLLLWGAAAVTWSWSLLTSCRLRRRLLWARFVWARCCSSQHTGAATAQPLPHPLSVLLRRGSKES